MVFITFFYGQSSKVIAALLKNASKPYRAFLTVQMLLCLTKLCMTVKRVKINYLSKLAIQMDGFNNVEAIASAARETPLYFVHCW